MSICKLLLWTGGAVFGAGASVAVVGVTLAEIPKVLEGDIRAMVGLAFIYAGLLVGTGVICSAWRDRP